MTTLQSLIRYFCCKYKHTSELSNARLTKMVYLCDWAYARSHGTQLTSIKWYFNNFGPYVDDVLKAADNDPEVVIVLGRTPYNTQKQTIVFKGDKNEVPQLSPQAIEAADHVISETEPLYWNDFIKHVYNTFPIRNNPRYSTLDLVEQAAEESGDIPF